MANETAAAAPLAETLSLTLTTGFHTATYPAGATFGPRLLTSFEFVWMMEGNAIYRHGEQTVDAPEGSLVLCRPPAQDAFRWDTHRRTRHAYFHFLLDGALPLEWPALETWPLVRRGADTSDLLIPLFRGLMAWGGGKTTGADAQTRFTALALLAAFVTGKTAGNSGGAAANLPEPVRIALTRIDLCLTDESHEPLTLTELARAASVTPEHLCRLFHTATGKSPMETVRLRRLERAHTLLTRTNYSVAEIAMLCGFASPFHFSRRFKEIYGIAPRDLRHRVG